MVLVRVKSQVRSGWVGLTYKNTGQVTDQPVFASSKKNEVRVRFFRARSGQKILQFAMSNQNILNYLWVNAN